MNNDRFDELSGMLSLEFAKENPRKFVLLLAKVIDTAVEYGVPEHNLHLMISNATEHIQSLARNDMRQGHIQQALAALGKLKGKSFRISWGPDHGRETGYFVSVPGYKGGEVVPVAEVEAILREG